MSSKTKVEIEAEKAAVEAENEKMVAEKAALEKQIEELKAQMAAMSTVAAQPAAQPAPAVYITTPNTDVTLVYTADCPGAVQYRNSCLECTRYGEEFTLPRSDFDEVVGKYRSWFNKGILAVSDKDIAIAKAKGVPTVLENGGLTYDKLDAIGSMSTEEIEKLWNSVSREGLKQSIVLFFKRKYEENAPGFGDLARIDTLNRLSNGGLTVIRDFIAGRNYVAPTNMLKDAKNESIKVL